MKRESTHITPIQYALGLNRMLGTLHRCTRLQGVEGLIKGPPIVCFILRDFKGKSMSCVIDYFQSVCVGNFLDATHITWLTIAMYWHDSCSLGGDSCLYFVRIHIASTRININKHGLTAIPPNAMGGSDKTIGRRYHLARYTQSL